jgi:hypothetical protein
MGLQSFEQNLSRKKKQSIEDPGKPGSHLDSTSILKVEHALPRQVLVKHQACQLKRSSHDGAQLFGAKPSKKDEQTNPDRVDSHLDSSGVVEVEHALPRQVLVKHRTPQLKRCNHDGTQIFHTEHICRCKSKSRKIQPDSYLDSGGVVEVEDALPGQILIEQPARRLTGRSRDGASTLPCRNHQRRRANQSR